MNMMHERRFYVEDFGCSSQHRPQRSGITQGCTLSPLLFIVLMIVLMSDAVAMLTPQARTAYVRGDLADITFADDTLLIGVSPAFLNEFLAAVSAAGQRYGMELHFGKLQLVNIQCETDIRMPNGQALAASPDMAYLGTTLHEDGRLGPKLGRRIGCAKGELRKLCKVWAHSSLTTAKKLHIYQSLVETKLLYGLSCHCLNAAEMRRLNGFQARCIRQVMRIPAAYYSRVSNRIVLEKSGSTAASQLLERQQIRMLGRVLRAPQDSPLHKAVVIPGTVLPSTSHYIRRRGRPRKEWMTTVLQAASRRNTGSRDLFAAAQDANSWHQQMHC